MTPYLSLILFVFSWAQKFRWKRYHVEASMYTQDYHAIAEGFYTFKFHQEKKFIRALVSKSCTFCDEPVSRDPLLGRTQMVFSG